MGRKKKSNALDLSLKEFDYNISSVKDARFKFRRVVEPQPPVHNPIYIVIDIFDASNEELKLINTDKKTNYLFAVNIWNDYENKLGITENHMFSGGIFIPNTPLPLNQKLPYVTSDTYEKVNLVEYNLLSQALKKHNLVFNKKKQVFRYTK